MAVLELGGMDRALTVLGAALILLVTACVMPSSADAGCMYQASRPRPPPVTDACFALKVFGVAVRISIVPKLAYPHGLRKPELVPIESALCTENKQ